MNLAFILVILYFASSEGFSPVVHSVDSVQQCGQLNIEMINEELMESLRKTLFTDCKDAYEKGQVESGVYTIKPGNQTAFEVYCDMDTDGGGWTVFQRRLDGSVDFYRDWVDYEEGFGNITGEYWLGLKDIHFMTTTEAQELRVDMEDFENETRYAYYSSFSVAGANDKYRLLVSGYSGTAGDSLSTHSGDQFSTRDQDNDSWGSSCAQRFKGAWWYISCHASNLNGLYHSGNHASYADGVNWFAWKGYNYSLKRAEMKIRRK